MKKIVILIVAILCIASIAYGAMIHGVQRGKPFGGGFILREPERGSPPAGGGTPAFTFTQKNGAVGKAVALTDVTSGSLIVSSIEWADSATAPTLSDGTNSPDGYTTVSSYGSRVYCRIAYWTSSPKSGSVTYTWTASGGGHTVHVYELSYTGTISVADSDSAAGENGNVATTASCTLSDTALAGFQTASWYNDSTYASATMDDVGVDSYDHRDNTAYANSGAMTMRIMNNPGTFTGVITVTGANNNWATNMIVFKVV